MYTHISYATHGDTPTTLNKSYYIYTQLLIVYHQVHLVYTQYVSHMSVSSILHNIDVLASILDTIKFNQSNEINHTTWFYIQT